MNFSKIATAFLTAALTGLVLPSPASADFVEVLTTDRGFLVTGGILLDPAYRLDRREAATCPNCHWKIVYICSFGEWQPNCPELLKMCRSDQAVTKVFRADASRTPGEGSSQWHFTGHSCESPDGVVSHEIISCILRGQWAKFVPDLAFHTSPPGRTLVNLPTKVIWDSPAKTKDKVTLISNLQINFRAVATRNYTCVDCDRVGLNEIRFPTRGKRTISANAAWIGTYDALGLTDIRVAGEPITNTAGRDLKVSQLLRRLKFPTPAP